MVLGNEADTSGGVARGSDKRAKSGNVWAVGANAGGVHGQAEVLGLVNIDSGVIEFGEAEAHGGRNPVALSRIDGPGRPTAIPRALGDFKELLPVAFSPHRFSPASLPGGRSTYSDAVKAVSVAWPFRVATSGSPFRALPNQPQEYTYT